MATKPVLTQCYYCGRYFEPTFTLKRPKCSLVSRCVTFKEARDLEEKKGWSPI